MIKSIMSQFGNSSGDSKSHGLPWRRQERCYVVKYLVKRGQSFRENFETKAALLARSNFPVYAINVTIPKTWEKLITCRGKHVWIVIGSNNWMFHARYIDIRNKIAAKMVDSFPPFASFELFRAYKRIRSENTGSRNDEITFLYNEWKWQQRLMLVGRYESIVVYNDLLTWIITSVISEILAARWLLFSTLNDPPTLILTLIRRN